MKYLIVFALLVVFAATCFASTSRDEILSQIEALDEAKEALLSQLDQPEQDVEQLSESEMQLKRCVNTNNLNVRNDNGQVTGEKINSETPVTIWARKHIGALEYGKIGNNRWIALKYVKMTCSEGLSLSQLRGVMPRLSSSKASTYLPHLNKAMAEAQINNCQRRSAFLAQLAHESAQLVYWEEIASGAAYEGRRDLGNTQRGDGRRYKGRGPIQLTGRANYRSASRDLGIDLEGNPTRAKDVDVGFRTAGWFWSTRGLNRYADGSQRGFDTITKRINGGYNGKADRDQYFRKAKSILGC